MPALHAVFKYNRFIKLSEITFPCRVATDGTTTVISCHEDHYKQAGYLNPDGLALVLKDIINPSEWLRIGLGEVLPNWTYTTITDGVYCLSMLGPNKIDLRIPSAKIKENNVLVW